MKKTTAQQPGYLLDAATCAAILRRTDAADLAVLDRLTSYPVSQIHISTVTLAELEYGAEVSQRTAQDRAALEVFLKHAAVLDYPRSAAGHYGLVRMILELCEVCLPTEPMLAAAHARALGITLISPLARDLARVPGMVVESWAA